MSTLSTYKWPSMWSVSRNRADMRDDLPRRPPGARLCLYEMNKFTFFFFFCSEEKYK